MRTNSFFYSSQHGFLKARSCLTTILFFLEEITKWIDEGSPVDIIDSDFHKAFDKVPHQILLLKLKGDQFEFVKILNGYDNLDRNMFFSLKKDNRTRGHEVTLVKDQCRLDIRKY